MVTVAEADREPLMKSPALARSVTTPSGTPVSSNVPPAAVRVVAQKSWPWALTVIPGEQVLRQPRDDAADERTRGEDELDFLGVVAGHHGLGLSSSTGPRSEAPRL